MRLKQGKTGKSGVQDKVCRVIEGHIWHLIPYIKSLPA